MSRRLRMASMHIDSQSAAQQVESDYAQRETERVGIETASRLADAIVGILAPAAVPAGRSVGRDLSLEPGRYGRPAKGAAGLRTVEFELPLAGTLSFAAPPPRRLRACRHRVRQQPIRSTWVRPAAPPAPPGVSGL